MSGQIRVEQQGDTFIATLEATGEVGFGSTALDAIGDCMSDYEVEGLEFICFEPE